MHRAVIGGRTMAKTINLLEVNLRLISCTGADCTPSTASSYINLVEDFVAKCKCYDVLAISLFVVFPLYVLFVPTP